MKPWLAALLCLMLISIDAVSAQDTPDLVAQVGFGDAALESLAARGQDLLGESLEFAAYDHSYRLLAVWSAIGGGSALLYRTDTTAPTLLWQQDYGVLQGQQPHLNGDHVLFSAPAPGDWDSSGVVEFAILGTADVAVSALASMVYIYGLTAEDAVVPRLSGAIPAGEVVTRIRGVSEGLYYLTVEDLRGLGTMTLPECCFPTLQRTYIWSGDTAGDISGQGAPNYYTDMGRLLLALTTLDRYPPEDGVDPAADYAARLLELLMVYDIIGQREAGLKLVYALVELRKSEQYLPASSYIDEVFLPAMDKFFEDGKPFLPPEYASANPPEPIDYYAEH